MSAQIKRFSNLLTVLVISFTLFGCAADGSGSDSGSNNEVEKTSTSNITYSPEPVVSSAIIAVSASEFNTATSTYSWTVAGIKYDETSGTLIWKSSGLPGRYLIETTVTDGANTKSLKKEMTVSSLNQWPFFRGSLQGVGSKTAIDTSNTVGQEKWKQSFSDGYAYVENYVSGVAIATDGSYYVASSKQDSTNDIELSKISATGDAVVWQLPKDDASSDIGDRITGTPVVDKDGTVYVGSRDKYLYAINPDGSQKWRFNMGNPAWTAATIGADGTVYIGTAAELNTAQVFYAVNSDGTEKWHFDTSNDVRASANIGADGTVYVRVIDGSLYALNPDGSQKWLFKEPDGGSGASPVIAADGTVYIGTFGSPAKLYAVNTDGSKKWEIELSGGVGATPVVGADGVIYVATWAKYVHAINPDGTEKWKSALLNDVIQSSPALGSDGTLYVAPKGQATIHALDTTDGSENWNYQVCNNSGMAIVGPLTIGSEGEILVHCNDGALYAIE